MTEQLSKASHTDGFINHPSHYDYQPARLSEYKSENISVDKFYSWSKDHMYQTSYGTSHNRVRHW